MDQSRKIIHIDMDAFFASVEQRDQPNLRGKPLIVGGRPESRGVVAAASYEARRFGIHSAMPASRAVRLCPQVVIVYPRFEVYRQVSQQIRAIFLEYTDLVEPLSLDEAYLDVTANKKHIPSATWIAEEIRRRIFKKTQLTASAGVGPNKFVAKIASDVNKPNGICVIPPSEVGEFIAKLPIGKFHGIGKATEKKMHQLGIFNGADLKRLSQIDLVQHFGKAGSYYFHLAHGEDYREVSPDRLRKSVGVEETFSRDIEDLTQMEAELDLMARELEKRLRSSGVSGKTVTLKLRYDSFETITRAESQQDFICDAETIGQIARQLLRLSEAGERKVRLLGITLSNLNNQPSEFAEESQLSLPLGNEWF